MQNSFRDNMHIHGCSTFFLTGITLFSAGSLLSVFQSFDAAAAFFSLMIMALPIIGFWLIYAASKTPSLPEKTLPALTLFKISVIIDLVIMGLVAIVILGLIYILGVADAMGFALLLFLLLCAVGVYIFFYYRAILGILKKIREGIDTGLSSPIAEVKLFTVFTYIRVGVEVLGALIMAAAAGAISANFGDMLNLGSMFDVLPDISSLLESTMLSSFFTMLSNVGIVICVIALNRFNESLGAANYAYTGQSAPYAQSPPHATSQPYAPPPQSCAGCGSIMKAGDVSCEYCGHNVLSGPATSTANTPPPQPPVRIPPAPAPNAKPTGYATPPPAAPNSRPSAYNTPPPAAPLATGYAPAPSAQPRMPILFLLDTSASARPHINELNTALNRFKSEVSQDVQARGILDVATIHFSDSFSVLQDYAPIGNMKPVRLIASGDARYSAPIQEALHMVGDYQRNQPNSYKPWIVLISGSRPSDDITSAANSIQGMQQADKLRFIALGAGSCDNAVLKRLTDVVFRLDGTDFASFFDWISRSMWATARTAPGEKPQLPPLQGNVYRDK